MKFRRADSPFGKLLIAGDAEGLKWICFERGDRAVVPSDDWVERDEDPLLRRTVKELREYFAGRRRRFTVPVAPEGTSFQRQVWRKLCAIPYGETLSYADVARRVRRPQGFRAVGAANGQNPVSIIVPCHRLVGSNGNLTGYGGGLETKRALLTLEGAL